MPDFYFFTEPAKLKNQTKDQAFGAVDENENKFRLGNLFSATADAKAFAITDGVVMVQQVTDNPALVNIVLKPENQPDLNFPKIEYILYKGINKSDLIDGTKVAESPKNDLTRHVWESHATLLAADLDAPEFPSAAVALGYNSSPDAPSDDTQLGTSFYNKENKLTKIYAGDHLGNFSADSFGIVIVMEKIGYHPSFKLARELDSICSLDAIGEDATPAIKFKRKHDKEEVLAFLDSTAFFSAFEGEGYKVYGDTKSDDIDADTFYQKVIAKHVNKNTLYLDIRNELQDSFNYYENYTNELKLALAGDDIFTEIDYYRSKWPLLALTEEYFGTANTTKTIGLSLPTGDNEFPTLFMKRGELVKEDSTTLTIPSERFLTLEPDETAAHYLVNEKIQVPKHADGQIKATYYQLNYIKKYTTPDSDYQRLSLRNESYLDNLFPIFDMKLPFSQESTGVKMFAEASYIDKTNINNSGFTVDVGIARDLKAITFIALPHSYAQESFQTKGRVPIDAEQLTDGSTFLEHFKKRTTEEAIEVKPFDDGVQTHQYLAFSDFIASSGKLTDIVVDDPRPSTFANDILVDKPLLNYDFGNFEILSLTLEEYAQLEVLKESEFTAPYKVYLGISEAEPLSEDGSFSTTYYTLRGLKENESGNLAAHEYVTAIKVLASDPVYNWDLPRIKIYSIDFRTDHQKYISDNPDYENGIYGFDWLREDYIYTCTSDYTALKKEYSPTWINGMSYYIPWLSIRKGQTVTLKINKNDLNINNYTEVSIQSPLDFTIAPANFRIDNTVTITCKAESPTPSRINIKADGTIVGALNIWHPRPKSIELDWVFVEFSQSKSDEQALDEQALNKLINQVDIERVLRKGLNPCLIDVVVNPNRRVLPMANEYAGYRNLGLVPSAPYDFGHTTEEYFDHAKRISTPNSGTVGITGYLIHDIKKRDKPNYDDTKLTVYCINRKIFNKTTKEFLAGFSAADPNGIIYMMKGRDGKISGDNLIHETLHSLGLKHSFSIAAKHTFKQSQTDNYMDYNNTPEHTWKWQWEQAYNYPHLT